MIRALYAALASAVLAQAAAAVPPDIPLYGSAAIPNSKAGPDEESSDGSWIKKVSRPVVQVYLPTKAKATGASVVIFPGGGYAGLSFDYEGTQQASFFIDHGIAAFVVKYRIPSDLTMVDKSMGPLEDAQQAMRLRASMPVIGASIPSEWARLAFQPEVTWHRPWQPTSTRRTSTTRIMSTCDPTSWCWFTRSSAWTRRSRTWTHARRSWVPIHRNPRFAFFPTNCT